MGAALPENLILGFIRVSMRNAWLKCAVRREARRSGGGKSRQVTDSRYKR